MTPASSRVLPAVVLALAAVYLVVLVPPAARSYVSDDMVFVIPILVSDAEGRSPWGALASLFAPDRGYLPRVVQRLYFLGSLWLWGPANAGLVYGGVLLHMASSCLVWTLARRLGLGARAAWLAAGLHLTAWAGFHASLWSSAVQHVVSSLGVLGVLNLYLATEQRRRAGAPWRGQYRATVVLALLSSLSRASSVIGPAAILAHALLYPGSARERLRRYDLWWPVVMLSALYPLALLAWGTDGEALGAVPAVANLTRRLVWHFGPGPVLAGAAGYLLLLLVVARAGLALWARSPWSSGAPLSRRWRLLLGAAGLAIAAPWLVRIAIVFVWGVEAFLWPLGTALNSHSTFRWHMTSLPLEAVGAGLAAAAGGAFLARHGRSWDLVPLGVVLAGFGYAVYSWEPRPLRYWIHVTPALALVLAAGMEALADRLGGDGPRAARWRSAALAAVAAAIILSNIAAIRVELWRHRVADA